MVILLVYELDVLLGYLLEHESEIALVFLLELLLEL